MEQCLAEAKKYDHVIMHTSTPSLKNDCKVAEAIKSQRPSTTIGFVGAQAAVLPAETLRSSEAIDWAGGKEFDFTCKEVAEGRPLAEVDGLIYRNSERKIIHNRERELIADMDSLPWVTDVYHRDLQVEKYSIGYLKDPYVSLYTGRGCPAQCTFCLWPQTIGGHKYRVRSAENVAAEMAHAKKLFPQVQEFFFDDDTFTANLPRAREIAKRLKPLGLTWSCNSRANVNRVTGASEVEKDEVCSRAAGEAVFFKLESSCRIAAGHVPSVSQRKTGGLHGVSNAGVGQLSGAREVLWVRGDDDLPFGQNFDRSRFDLIHTRRASG